MDGRFDSRHPLVALADELIRLNGRVKSLFAGVQRDAGVGDSKMAVLNAVVEAERPPTVSQIGRSIGQPRQLIQRAADALMAAGLIEPVPNPDHKTRCAAAADRARHRAESDLDARADAVARAVWGAAGDAPVIAATLAIRNVRKLLEAQLRDAAEPEEPHGREP